MVEIGIRTMMVRMSAVTVMIVEMDLFQTFCGTFLRSQTKNVLGETSGMKVCCGGIQSLTGQEILPW